MAGQTSHCLDVDGLGTVRRASCRRSYVDAMVTWGTPLGCCRALMTRAPKGYPSRRFPRHELPLGEAVGPTTLLRCDKSNRPLHDAANIMHIAAHDQDDQARSHTCPDCCSVHAP